MPAEASSRHGFVQLSTVVVPARAGRRRAAMSARSAAIPAPSSRVIACQAFEGAGRALVRSLGYSRGSADIGQGGVLQIPEGEVDQPRAGQPLEELRRASEA